MMMIIKVCGMTHADNIRQVASMDIQWMGFIFYPKSPRYFTGSPAMLPPGGIKRVGVFVNAPLEEMLRKQEEFRLDYLQLHGAERPELCRELRKHTPVIKAISIATWEDVLQTKAYEDHVDYFLFDTKCPAYGGSGRRFDWSVLNIYQGETPFLLSGGLSPGCMDELEAFHHPMCAGVDLNSGFEVTAGIKDYTLLYPFINRLKTNKS